MSNFGTYFIPGDPWECNWPDELRIALYALLLIWLFLGYTRHGRLMYAIGSNERAAELVGTNVQRYKIVAYMISGMLASVGGILLAARLGRGDIASGNNLLLDSVAAALIGFAVLGAARPNAFGTAAGALFVGILLQGLTMMNAPYYMQDFVKGALVPYKYPRIVEYAESLPKTGTGKLDRAQLKARPL